MDPHRPTRLDAHRNAPGVSRYAEKAKQVLSLSLKVFGQDFFLVLSGRRVQDFQELGEI